jgi:hypothetical protein
MRCIRISVFFRATVSICTQSATASTAQATFNNQCINSVACKPAPLFANQVEIDAKQIDAVDADEEEDKNANTWIDKEWGC